MGKFKCSTKCSRARSKARNFGHYKTSFGGKHVRVTVGTKGIHSSIKMGPVTYKPGSGRYSVKTPIKGVTYYGKTNNSTEYSNYSYSDDYDELGYYVNSFVIGIISLLFIFFFVLFISAIIPDELGFFGTMFYYVKIIAKFMLNIMG